MYCKNDKYLESSSVKINFNSLIIKIYRRMFYRLRRKHDKKT